MYVNLRGAARSRSVVPGVLLAISEPIFKFQRYKVSEVGGCGHYTRKGWRRCTLVGLSAGSPPNGRCGRNVDIFTFLPRLLWRVLLRPYKHRDSSSKRERFFGCKHPKKRSLFDELSGTPTTVPHLVLHPLVLPRLVLPSPLGPLRLALPSPQLHPLRQQAVRFSSAYQCLNRNILNRRSPVVAAKPRLTSTNDRIQEKGNYSARDRYKIDISTYPTALPRADAYQRNYQRK
jgi:hypothetical protein